MDFIKQINAIVFPGCPYQIVDRALETKDVQLDLDADIPVRVFWVHAEQPPHVTRAFRKAYPEAPVGFNNVVMISKLGSCIRYSS